MSRYSFDQSDGGSLGIGWDPGLDTYFLQTDEHLEEPTIWEGWEHGQHHDPDPLVAIARQHSDEVPADFARTLRADREAAPGWRPASERIASGELRITLVEGSNPPERLSPATTVRGLWERITTPFAR